MSRALGTLLAVIAICLASPATAQAGTYQVSACSDAPAYVNSGWSSHNNAPGPGQLEVGSGCGATGTYSGLFARDALTCGESCLQIPGGAVAGWTFDAPGQTMIVGISYSRWLYKDADDDWQPALTADGVVVPGETCAIVYPAVSCSVGAQGGQRVQLAIRNASSLDFGVLCRPNPSGNCVGGATLHDVAAVLYGATVTLSDSSLPSLANLSGSFLDGGYLSGTRALGFDAADNAGVRSSRFYFDGSRQPAVVYGCDFTLRVPCSNQTGAELTFDTRRLADGAHTVEVGVSDPAGNERKSSAKSVVVDNTAPAAPLNLSVDGGDGWRSSNDFSVSWANPGGQVAPIAAAQYEICSVDGSSCGAPARVAGSGIQQLSRLIVPSNGEWLLRLWLEDAAGNASSATAATAVLRYGSAPVAPSPAPASTEPTTTTTTAPTTLADDAPAVANPVFFTPIADSTPTTLLSPALRVTSARYGHGRLILRARTAKTATGSVTVRLRVNRRVVRIRRAVHGGAFRLTIRTKRPSCRLLVRFSRTSVFQAQAVTARIR